LKRKFLIGFVTALFISGCGIKTSGISENIKINFSIAIPCMFLFFMVLLH